MKHERLMAALLVALLASASAGYGQIVERERPAAWSKLVKGGRLADYFLPMKAGRQAEGVWGATGVQGRFIDNGIEKADMSFWGGNILQTADGKYHLFVCGWPEHSPKGHMAWGGSTLFHTVSDSLDGPYEYQDIIGKGHNPEAFRLDDGRVVVYVIGGYYVADSVDGPWEYRHFDFNANGWRIIEGLSNLSFTRRSDGSFLMVDRGGGIWVSRDGLSTYTQLTEGESIYPKVAGEFEDPVIWRDSLQYHSIVNDWLGRIAYYQRSLDGLHWVTEPGEAYVPGIAVHPDGKPEEWFKYERVKVFQDPYGRVEQMNFAVIDTIKWEDHPKDRHSSKNICLPFNKGVLAEVLNEKPITASTRTIEVLVRATEDFDPQADLDLSSLRFGSFKEVNYGRGAKLLRTKTSGKDLILLFSGKGSGIDAAEFAPKLLGRDRRGGVVYGYARLPYVDYRPAVLTASRPLAQGGSLRFTVTNFGLSASHVVAYSVLRNGVAIARGEVPALTPYQSWDISTETTEAVAAQDTVSVRFE